MKMKTVTSILILCMLQTTLSLTDIGAKKLRDGTGISIGKDDDSVILFDLFPFDFAYEDHVVITTSLSVYVTIDTVNWREDDVNRDTVCKYIFSVRSIRYDWIGRNVYVLESNKLEICHISDGYTKTLYKFTEEALDMEIDPVASVLFIAFGGENSRIEKTDMDGSYGSRIIIANLSKPGFVSLALDRERKLVYWSNRKQIEQCSYTGNDRVNVTSFNSSVLPDTIRLLDDIIFFIEHTTLSAMSLSLSTGHLKNLTKLSSMELMMQVTYYSYNITYTSDYFKMEIFQPNTVRDLNNITENYCDQLLFPSPRVATGYTCVCGAGYNYSQEEGSCIKEEIPTILAADFLDSKMFLIKNYTEHELRDDLVITSVDYGKTENEVIFLHQNVIYMTNVDNPTIYLKSQYGSFIVWFISYDWLGDNIYYTSFLLVFGVHYIYANRQNMHCQIVQHQGPIVAFAVDSNNGIMFYMGQRAINKSPMDGNGPSVIKANPALINWYGSLGLDYEEQMVYWGSGTYISALRRCDYFGQNEVQITPERSSVEKVVIFRDHIITFEALFLESYVARYDKRTAGDFVRIHGMTGNTKLTIQVFNADVRSKGSSPCQTNNANCSDFCLVSTTPPYYVCRCDSISVMTEDKKTCRRLPCWENNGGCSMRCNTVKGLPSYSCSCDEGFTLQPDNKTCSGEMGAGFLYLYTGGLIRYETERNIIKTTPLPIKVQTRSLVLDPIDRAVFINDNQHIYRYLTDTEEFGVISQDQKDRVILAIDWVSRYLIWSAGKSEIWSLKLDGTKERRIYVNSIKNMVKTGAITVDSLNGYVYQIQQVLLGLHLNYSMACFKLTFETDNVLDNCLWGSKEMGNTVLFVHVMDNFNLKMYYLFQDDFQEGKATLQRMNIDWTDRRKIRDGSTISTVFRLEMSSDDYILAQDYLDLKINKINPDTGEITNVIGHLGQMRENFQVTQGMNKIDFGKDEDFKDNGTICADYERCIDRSSRWTCLKAEEICDGEPKCYGKYDEFLCNFCTENCEILKLNFVCKSMSNKITVTNNSGLAEYIKWHSHPLSKVVEFNHIFDFDCSLQVYMNASSDHVKTYEIHSLHSIHRLRQVIMTSSFQNVANIHSITLSGPPMLSNISAGNLIVFENVSNFRFEDSSLVSLPDQAFLGMSVISELLIVSNRLLRQFHPNCFKGLFSLKMLTVSNSYWSFIPSIQFLDQVNLTVLNLSYNHIQIFEEGVFHSLVNLKVIDTRYNDIKLTSDLFVYTHSLAIIFGDSFTLCCVQPPGAVCVATEDEISSCSNLIKNRVLAGLSWVLGILALFGNLIVLVYRSVVDRSLFVKAYYIFVVNLGISDLIMAIYLLIIAYHDVLYNGTYVWNDYTWKRGRLCKVAGVLSMLSSEASLIFITHITIERFLIVKFAFGNIKISRKYAVIMSVVSWLIAISLSVLPLISYEELFARNGVCIAIPLTRGNDTGIEYTTVVFLGINFLISAFIPFGQYQIYKEVKRSSKKVQSTQTGREIEVAKRLSAVVITDCACWLPIGCLVILSLAGIKTPNDVYSWIIVLVLPLNSAINPYIYTLTKLDTQKYFPCLKKKESHDRKTKDT